MAAQLRRMMKEKEIIYTVGVGDALAAKIACATEGIDAILSSGFSVSACMYGLPDAEFYTRSENALAVKAMCDVSNKPIIADIDTGYGNAVTVIHSVNEFEKAGAAAVIIEDQVSPKRCPISVNTENKLISLKEAVGKIRAAVENRLNKDTVIIARTDSPTYEMALERALAFKEVGADAIQIYSGAYNDAAGAKRIQEEVGLPLSLIVCGRLEVWTKEDIEFIKPKFAQFALAPVNVATKAMMDACAYIGKNKTTVGMPTQSVEHMVIQNLLGMDRVEKLQLEYLPSEEEL